MRLLSNVKALDKQSGFVNCQRVFLSTATNVFNSVVHGTESVVFLHIIEIILDFEVAWRFNGAHYKLLMSTVIEQSK